MCLNPEYKHIDTIRGWDYHCSMLKLTDDYPGTIPEILEDLKALQWTDAAVGAELGVTGQSVWRWRHVAAPVSMARLVRAGLLSLLARSG